MTTARPPSAFPGTPPPLPGSHDLRLGGMAVPSVFVDTNVYLHTTYLKALVGSAKSGDLSVVWSAEIQAEIVRIVERAVADKAARRLRHLPPDDRSAAVESELARVGQVLQNLMVDFSQYFRRAPSPPPIGASELIEIADPDDRAHVLAARATGARYLPTLDERNLPHGANFAGVECWHPDTFLTLYFQQSPAGDDRAREAVQGLPAAHWARLLP